MNEIAKRETVQIERVQSQEDIINELSTIEDDYQQYLERLSERQVNRAQGSIRAMRTGLYAVAPLICGGPGRCLFFERCPIPEVDPMTGEVDTGKLTDYPIYRSCLLEKMFMQQKTIEYIQHLNVDPNNPIEMAIVSDLAVIDLYKYRSVAILSAGDKDGYGQDFTMGQVVGVNQNNGEAIEQTQVHPAIAVMDQLERRRERLMDKLNETRKAKMDLSIRLGGGDNENQMLKEIQALRNALEDVASGKLIEIESDEDELIMLEGAM